MSKERVTLEHRKPLFSFVFHDVGQNYRSGFDFSRAVPQML